MSVSILVVEDETELQQSIRRELVGEGYVVYATRSAEEAARILTRTPHPCLFLWDPLSPGTASLVGIAHAHRVRIAVIPVSATWGGAQGSPHLNKRLLCRDALMAIVRQHCPLSNAA